ncbi:hypothetical protein AJ79_05822 [Helicocarpus griseus UAMH5409]|uniref:Peptidase A1 domain-containing protein n=1 Tax=Helicocarpus griseus UAMH5409 TaxID=1447875 RepID=A0A2B7XKC0_9EURO|nr:hypothetical protein AJ79_05822 [Helicocarpus griseus UAMH5409]
MWYPGSFGIAVALSSTLAIAGPIQKRSGFTIQQILKPRPVPRSPMEDYAVAVMKNDPLSTDLLDIILNHERSVNRTVPAVPEPFDYEYLSPVNVAGEILDIALDTGSSDFWVFSSQQSLAQRSAHQFYTPAPGKLPLDGQSWRVAYADRSSARGNVYIDTVSIADVVSPSQAIQAAQDVSEEFVTNPTTDGVLGLAFPSINHVRPNKQLGFFDNVKDTLPKPVFAVALKKSRPGTFDFGFINNEKYVGNITYTPVHNNGFWTITTTGTECGNFIDNTPLKGILDTGSSFLLLPKQIVSNYYSQIPGARRISSNDPRALLTGWIFPCEASILPFTLIIENSYHATIPPEHVNQHPYYFDEGEPPMCFGGIQETFHEGMVVFGDVLFKSQYVVFDRGGTRVGFARQREEPVVE